MEYPPTTLAEALCNLTASQFTETLQDLARSGLWGLCTNESSWWIQCCLDGCYRKLLYQQVPRVSFLRDICFLLSHERVRDELKKRVFVYNKPIDIALVAAFDLLVLSALKRHRLVNPAELQINAQPLRQLQRGSAPDPGIFLE